jgi:hypothetical protein
MKLISLILSLMAAVCAHAAMVRVVSVDDARTLTIDRGGARERIELAGVSIADEARAAELLVWTLQNAWVMVEPHAAGGHLVWRSPDALFVNRELVQRGYARATAFGIEAPSNLNVTYLGQLDPPLIERPRETGTGTNRRSSEPRTRRNRPPSAETMTPEDRSSTRSGAPAGGRSRRRRR